MACKLSPQGWSPVNSPRCPSFTHDCILQASPKTIESSYHNPLLHSGYWPTTLEPLILVSSAGNANQRRKGGTCTMVQALCYRWLLHCLLSMRVFLGHLFLLFFGFLLPYIWPYRLVFSAWYKSGRQKEGSQQPSPEIDLRNILYSSRVKFSNCESSPAHLPTVAL